MLARLDLFPLHNTTVLLAIRPALRHCSRTCLDSCWWYRAPATSRVTGLAMPISRSWRCMSASRVSPSWASAPPFPARVPLNFSASCTISWALAISPLRSWNASSSVLHHHHRPLCRGPALQ